MEKLKALLLASTMLGLSAAQASAEWVSIGQGHYFEGLVTYYGEEMGIPTGLSWAVDIEEDTDTKGLYRLAPYSGNNPMAELMGSSDDTYMIIHAEDPAKVWMEDFDCYDEMLCFTHMVAESGWEGTSAAYGTLDDGVISFPAMCMATVDITDPEGAWHSANREGDFKIVLPGSGTEVEDYSLYLDYKYCGSDDLVPVTITVGQSIRSLVYLLEEGMVYADPDSETNADLDLEATARVVSEGEPIEAGEQLIKCPAAGLHSLLIVGLNSDGEACNGKIAYIYGTATDDNEWTSLGMATYNEDLFAGYYEGWPQVELEVELQVNKESDGYYRLVNPYAGYEGNYIENHDGYNHYIYIHAENPDAVWVENSPIGVDFADGYGEARVTSNVAMLIEDGYTVEEAVEAAGEEVGRLSDRVIEFTNWGLWIGQTGWFNGYWTSTGQNFRVTLPETTGIDQIIHDSVSAPEYYNLQGINIPEPTAGFYIEKRGNTVTKKNK